MMRLRKISAEGSFAVLKREHCISKIRKKGISAATEECLLAAMVLNLKRMVRAIFYKLKIQFTWAKEVFPQPGFSFCQQVPYCTLSHLIILCKNFTSVARKRNDLSKKLKIAEKSTINRAFSCYNIRFGL